MDTKFSEFNKDEYKKIRKFILNFSKEETGNDSFSMFFRNEHAGEMFGQLEIEIENKFGIKLKDFFNTYRKRIYQDSKFTQCCGFIDYILYIYNKNHPLGGEDIVKDIESNYSKIFRFNYNRT